MTVYTAQTALLASNIIRGGIAKLMLEYWVQFVVQDSSISRFSTMHTYGTVEFDLWLKLDWSRPINNNNKTVPTFENIMSEFIETATPQF
jgi:hypothetical protein